MNKTKPTPLRLKSCNRMVEKIDRRAAWMPDAELEQQAELPKNKLSKIRKGQQYVRADEIWRIARALETPVQWFLDDEIDSVPDVEHVRPASHLAAGSDKIEGTRRNRIARKMHLPKGGK